MARNRSAGIVIKDGKALLMHRINNGEEYYVFPGGGVEEGETPEQTVVREIDEETSVTVIPKKLAYHIRWDSGEEDFYYLCEYVSGEPKLREGTNEYRGMKENNQVYEPMWVDVESTSNLTLYALEIRDLFVMDYKNGFPDDVQSFEIKMVDRRSV